MNCVEKGRTRSRVLRNYKVWATKLFNCFAHLLQRCISKTSCGLRTIKRPERNGRCLSWNILEFLSHHTPNHCQKNHTSPQHFHLPRKILNPQTWYKTIPKFCAIPNTKKDRNEGCKNIWNPGKDAQPVAQRCWHKLYLNLKEFPTRAGYFMRSLRCELRNTHRGTQAQNISSNLSKYHF